MPIYDKLLTITYSPSISSYQSRDLVVSFQPQSHHLTGLFPGDKVGLRKGKMRRDTPRRVAETNTPVMAWHAPASHSTSIDQLRRLQRFTALLFTT
jgi:hypothetical protein